MLVKVGTFWVVLVAVLSPFVSGAMAQGVEVQNPGHHELEAEVAWGVEFHAGGVELPALYCDYSWEATVDASGHFQIDLDIVPHTGQSVFCAGAGPCDDQPWEGQISEAGGGFEAEFTICFEGTGTSISNVPVTVECPISDTEIHCDWPVAEGAEVSGEIVMHDSLGLTHAQ